MLLFSSSEVIPSIWQNATRQTKSSLLVLILFFSQFILVIRSTSSDFSFSDIDFDKIPDFPLSDSEQWFTSPLVSHESEMLTSHSQQHTNLQQNQDQAKMKKRTRDQRKRQKLKQDPIKFQRKQKQKRESTKRLLSSLSEEELSKRKRERRAREREIYQVRKMERGYASKQTEELKDIRQKIRLCTATSEEILKYRRNLDQKRRSAWKKKMERSQNKKGDHV